MSEGFDPYHKWLGIPPKDQPPNHYRLLGLEMFESDPEVIDTAASRLMSHLQELASGPEVKHSQKLLNEIAAARRCLLKSETKNTYDEQLRVKQPKAPPPRKKPTVKRPPEAPPAAPPKAVSSAPPKTAPSSPQDTRDSFPGITVDAPQRGAKEKAVHPPRKTSPSASAPNLSDTEHLADLEKRIDEPAKQEDPAVALARIDQQSSEVPTPSPSHAPAVRTEDKSLQATIGQEPFWRKNRRLWLIVGGGGVTVALVVVLLALLTPDDSNVPSDRSARPAQRQAVVSPPRLAFDWQPEHRRGATLAINGESKEIALEGPLEFELEQGSFLFRIDARVTNRSKNAGRW